MKQSISVFIAGVVISLFTGCGKQAPDRDVQLMVDLTKASEAAKNMANEMTEKVVSRNASTPPPLPEVPKPPQKNSGANLQTPLEKYVLLPSEDRDRGFVFLYSALGGKFLGGDEELLKIVSARYYSERDAFKRKDIEAAERPRVAAEIERYRQMRYIAFDLGGLGIDPYDFEKKGFALMFRNDCANSTLRVGSGIILKSFNAQGNCLGFKSFLVVDDDAVAKNVEALRATSNLSVRAIVYAYAEEAAEGQIAITPTAIRLRMFNSQQLYGGIQEQAKPVADLMARK